MAQKKQLDYVISWQTDTAALNRTLQDAKRVETAVETGYEQIISAAKRGELSVNEMRLALQAVGQSDTQIDQVAASLRAADQQAEALADSANRVDDALDRASTRRVNFGNALEGADRLGSVGSQVFSGLGNSQLANLAGLVGDVAGSFTTLNPIIAGTVLVGGAASLVFGELSRNIEAAKDAAIANADLQEQNALLIASGATSNDVRDQLRNAEATKAYLDSQLAYLNELEAAGLAVSSSGEPLEKIDAALGHIFDEFNRVTGLDVDWVGDMQVGIDALTAKSTQYGNQILNLNDLLTSGALDVNTAAAAFETFKDGLADGIRGLGSDVQDFFSQAAEAYAKGQEQLSQQTDQYFAALADEEKIRDRIADLNQQIAAVQLETAEKLLQLEQDRDERIAQIEADYVDKRGELTAEGEEKRQQIIADSNEKIARIQRDSGRKLFTLMAQRDALAYYLEAQQSAQQIKDEQDNAAKALEQQKKAEDKALAQAQKAYEKQLATAQSGYEKQVRALQDASSRQLNTLYQRINTEQVALQNLQIALQSIALYGSNQQRVIHTQMWQDVNYIAVSWASNTVNTLLSIFGNSGGNSGGGGGGGGGTGGGFGISQAAAFNRQFDRRLNQTLRGGRELIA